MVDRAGLVTLVDTAAWTFEAVIRPALDVNQRGIYVAILFALPLQSPVPLLLLPCLRGSHSVAAEQTVHTQNFFHEAATKTLAQSQI